MSDLLPYKLGKKAVKELKKIRKSDANLYRKIDNTINRIRGNPYLGEAKKGDLKGYFCIDITHIGTNYELCYTLVEDENGKLILIILIGTRENFYTQLKRYLEK